MLALKFLLSVVLYCVVYLLLTMMLGRKWPSRRDYISAFVGGFIVQGVLWYFSGRFH